MKSSLNDEILEEKIRGVEKMDSNNLNNNHYDYSVDTNSDNKTGLILSIVSICCGVASAICCWVPIVYMLGFITGPAAIITGIIAITQKGTKGLAIAGIITGGVGVILCVINLIVGFAIGTFGLV